MIQQLNDSPNARTVTWTALSGVNVLAAIASGAFGVVAIANPAALVGSRVAPEEATSFFVDMYGLRAVIIAGGLIAAALTMRRAPRVGAAVLLGGGLIQLGDLAIAGRFGTPGVVGASLAAAVHLGSAGLLLRFARRIR